MLKEMAKQSEKSDNTKGIRLGLYETITVRQVKFILYQIKKKWRENKISRIGYFGN